VSEINVALPSDAVELLRQVRPAEQQRFIEEVTQALATRRWSSR
jgi:hypothetical protein